MKTIALMTLVLGAAGTAVAQPSHPPLAEYLMERDAEIALARTAAPDTISGRATVKVLTNAGYEIAVEGNNGFTCMVMRGWAAPTYTPAQFRDLVYDAAVRAPICFDPEASRMVLPYYELQSRMGLAGRTPDEIARLVEAAHAKGEASAT